MRALIDRLVASGNAYVAEDNVLFSVPSMPDYGRLSKRPLDEMIAGARVEVAPYKRDAMDFVLWKPSKPGEPAWSSPAGIKAPGRPGWHIECSAMSWKHLGEIFDIHGGGIDLVFPHHENEIAQSRCAFHTPVMANYWMHNGFLQVEGEKMSKSLGNFVTIHELLKDWHGVAWPGMVIRFALLLTHYRQPLDFTEHALDEASMTLRSFHFFASAVPAQQPSEEFLEAMADDLNTPRAITELHRLQKIAKSGSPILSDAASQLTSGLRMLGFDIQDYDPEWLQKQVVAKRLGNRTPEIERLITARTAARTKKDWKESDRIRDELAAMGVVLKDSKDGTTWEIAR
jgi:cysteinyl-tRNA synthetase